MNKELVMVFLPAASWLLFALGGTRISKTNPGWKGYRRFILPAVYLATTLLLGVILWKALTITAISIFAYSLGYGESHSWTEKTFVAIAYGAITIPIGISVWNLFTVAGFLLLFALSNTKLTSSLFTWKICEGIFGLLVGIELAYILMGL